MRSIRWIILLGLLAAGCAPQSSSTPSADPIVPAAIPTAVSTASHVLPDKTPVPEVTPLPTGPQAPAINNPVWLNTEPLTQAQLNGQVVLVEFWTFGCINCLNTIPAMQELYQRYKDRGLIVIGVHSPEFDYEHDVKNVKDAIARLGVSFPVVLDNDFATWNAFRNHYWPALYLSDKRGIIRSTHIGELHENTAGWTEFTALIETLLQE
ncbi:MAG TPA: redoxin domain-containing protein [Anaerolineae bacterium]|nr:redoxin domain-containing protein [Anaerolineae bacterium]